ncbi:EamA family transporter [Mergibacter septicus]|uniref:EamA family transporter n=1 Tax=Mergibacter septicus TaxID=221402 RepID=A0A8D4LJB2_9PAST|nr:DMT family transporter [Mergibacter septicus]AWX15370.1 EamA family transporter [Mergibacter septicus]QDJ12848.1 EamA family transporter [Mergibacter septicus]QDJ14624.1 EamA family transporter [Mergibacter septicus]UTU47943.1 DMT family transporter [Mergibacter septicus]WMR96451.1 DMT family transporter [Mergibacter septicus]
MTHYPIKGAIAMVSAGVFFAVINTLTPLLSQTSNIASTNVALYQYLIALVFLLPSLLKNTSSLKTHYFLWHLLRVFLSVIGIQCWVSALTHGIPIWQGIALLMTSPLFVIIGSAIFLKEKVDTKRWLATAFGFTGAMLILEPWSDKFQWLSLLPVLAAFFWAAYSVMVKKLSANDSPTTMVAYLFILITPFNFIIGFKDLAFPTSIELGYLLLLGFLTALAQLAIAKAYSYADASYLQTFDFFKLPLNVFAGWLVFEWVPPGRLWLGAAIIIAATIYITREESRDKFVEQKN